MRAYALLILTFVFSANLCIGQQIADSAFTHVITTPSYPFGTGPVITLDEEHYNFHTLGGRYYPFAKLLRGDGYMLIPGTETFSEKSLSNTDILVIANALPDDGEWVLPTRSAFTDDEVSVVEEYVKSGGSLLLIADHMPFPGAAEKLAAAFGFTFVNGFAVPNVQRAETFSRKKGNLLTSSVTQGRSDNEIIDSILLFTGQGFMAPPSAQAFLLLDSSYTILLPERAWEFSDDTPQRSGVGHVAGACMEYGKGKIVVMGEAAMFTAQLAGPQRQKVGMNHPSASQNPQLLLNIIHWLDRAMDDE
jgi:hypothetical protein